MVSSGPQVWRGLAAGPHSAGFRQVGAGNAVSLWYPATEGGTAVTLRRYYGAESARAYEAFLIGAGVPATTARATLDTAMAAREDAPPAPGRYAVVLIAQGNAHAAPDQAVLAEFLATHGYIVVTTPSPMVDTPMTSEEQVGPFAERQAGELQQALAVATSTLDCADAARAGVIGHSFGARAALLLAMRDPRMKAIVSLDGGIGTATAIAGLRTAPSFDTARATAPILHYYERLDAYMAPDFTLLNSLPARVTTREVTGMHHIHFTTLGFLAAITPELAAITGAGPQIDQSLLDVANGTLAFLDAHVGQGIRHAHRSTPTLRRKPGDAASGQGVRHPIELRDSVTALRPFVPSLDR